jgi:hypothetical protein
MSGKLKIEYTKSESIFGNTATYNCTITDRRTDLTFYGKGNSKEEAKEEALDDFYKWDTNQREYSWLESSIYYKKPADEYSDDENEEDLDEDEDDTEDEDEDDK